MSQDAAIIICVMVLAILFGGEPDLMDRFIGQPDTCAAQGARE